MDTKEALLYILRKTVMKNDNGLLDVSECEFDHLYSLAKMHDLAHIVGFFIGENRVLADDGVLKSFEKDLNAAVMRDSRLEYAREITYGFLKDAGIAFVPLKGSVVRDFYPETWMRTSCDIDILVREDELEKALAVLTENGFTTDGERDFHDISVYLGNTHIELHFNICENIPRVDGLLKDVWSYVQSTDGSQCCMTPEYFAFYHIAHMCYHFIRGGCGIKPFIDLYLLKNSGYYNEDKLFCLLDKCELHTFYEKLCELNEVWFGSANHNDITLTVEKYILEGGTYGTLENGSAVSSAYNKGKASNFFRIVFPNYAAMCNYYPTVKKHKITLPFFYIKRIFSRLTGKGSDVVFRMRTIATQNETALSNAREMLKSLGLD